MINNFNDDVLREKGIKEEYFLFCQLWKELTDSKTFDSYQFKSFNIINGVDELIHNIDNYLNGLVPTNHSVLTVKEELLKAIKRDYVLEKSFINIKNILRNILGKKHDSDSALKALRYQLKLYKNELNEKYDNALIELLSSSVNDSGMIVSMTATFISRCIDSGWSSKALSTKLDLSDGKELKDFLKKVFNYSDQTYIVLFPFRQLEIIPPKGKTKEDSKNYVREQLSKFNIPVKTKEVIKQQYHGIDPELLKESEYIVVEESGKDIYSASHLAIISLSNVLNILSFFSAIEPWSVKNKTWIGFNTESPYSLNLRPIDIYRTYEYLDSSSIVYNRIERLMHNDTTNQEFNQKLISAFSYSNLSHVSMTIEEKYMNMWIALESLTRTDANDGIINNIIQCVPNACSLRYIYREIRNFAEDCGRCNISLDFASIKINLQDSDKEKIVKQMLTVLKDDTLYQMLINRCEICSLLKYRCQEIRNFIVDEKKLVSHITSHHKTVEWHLDRLYRIRNEIAHSASFQRVSIVRYVEHLYDYIATYITEIVRFASRKGISSFGELYTAINDNYQEFELLTADKAIKKNMNLLQAFFNSGIMDFI